VSYTVGSVPYLNARPLVHALPESVSVIYHVPSKLPELLGAGQAQAVLVSSIEAVRRPGLRIAPDASISSIGEVMSVRLFSKVPPEQIQTLALDRSSMTSNALAQIILRERFRTVPAAKSESPNLEKMLEGSDAAILIGDNGMRASGEGLHVLDLGLEWERLTGLPFVWALWLGSDGLDEQLAAELREARRKGLEQIDEIIADEVSSGRWHPAICRRYLTEVMNYELTDRHIAGLQTFADKLVEHGLVAQRHPLVVGSALATAG
jgi:chorismate dehydratase